MLEAKMRRNVATSGRRKYLMETVLFQKATFDTGKVVLNVGSNIIDIFDVSIDTADNL